MYRRIPAFLFLVLGLGLLQGAVAQNSATQDVTINVPQIMVIDVNNGGVTFDFTNNDVTAGSATASLTDTRSYDLFTNIPNNGSNNGVKITGALGNDYATGITLSVNMSAPSNGGSSQGNQSLSTSATDLVTGISPTAESGINIQYTATITPDAAPSSGSTETVTYTVTAQ